MSKRTPKPVEPKFVSLLESTYKGRSYYGSMSNVNAELAWRRDLCEWYEKENRGFQSFANSVNEALNSGDGSYRP